MVDVTVIEEDERDPLLIEKTGRGVGGLCGESMDLGLQLVGDGD